MKRILLIAFLALCGILPSAALDLDSLEFRAGIHNRWCSPEKLYVHLDRTCYAAGETIWFKGYLYDALPQSGRQGSNYIYAELLDSEGNAVLRHKIKRTEDGFPGCMFLPDDVKGGEYVFRAYTLWQMNRPSEYMFNQKLSIVGVKPVPPKERTEASDSIDISFYPEGGRYFSGRQAVVGFKVTDKCGRSVEFSGLLCDDRGNTLQVVETQFDGMGKFGFVPAAGRRYFIRTGRGLEFGLPEASSEGATISLSVGVEGLEARIYGKCDGICTLVAMGKELSRISAMELRGGRGLKMEIPQSAVQPGINHLLLLDEAGRILSERKFFVYGDDAPKCSFDSVRTSHNRCAPLSAVIRLSDGNGVPVDGNCSVSVLRGAFKRFRQQDGIESYMGLSAELKGHINDPRHYFDADIPLESRMSDMDLLMMIQGWTYYDFEHICSSNEPFMLYHNREYVQTLRGRVLNGHRGKMPKNYSFILFIPSLNITQVVSVGAADSYIIEDIDFPENTKVLVGVNRYDDGRDYIPRWSGDKFALPFTYAVAPGRGTDVEDNYLPIVSDAAILDTLSAAVVTAAAYEDPFGIGIGGREVSLEEMEFFKDYSLVNYVLYRTPRFEYNGEYMYNRLRLSTAVDDEIPEDGFESSGKVKLLDDGMEAEWFVYETVKVEDLAYLNISTENDLVHDAEGGIVAIKLAPGKAVDKSAANEPVLCFIPLGYQKPSAFYSPRYDRGDAHDSYDCRNTVYWNPEVRLEEGRAVIEFCDTDQQDYPYFVQLEGVSSDGRPFSAAAVME